MYPTAEQGGSARNQAAQGYAGTLGGPTPTNGRVQIPGLLDEQAGALMELNKTIHEFENRLSMVLAHDVPTAAGVNAKDSVAPVQVSDRLMMANSAISGATAHIRELMSRLHL